MDPDWVPGLDDRFFSFTELEDSMEQYQAFIKKGYRRENCHKINDDKLIFHSLTYNCKCHGYHETTGSRKSKKCGCPSSIKLSTCKESDKKYLKIIQLNLEHNHECESIQKKYCEYNFSILT